MKAVIRILTLIIIIALAMSLITLFWVFISKTFSSLTSTGETTVGETLVTISSCMKIESVAGNKVYLRNCGKGSITEDSLNIYLDDELFNFTMSPRIVNEDEVGTLSLSGLWKFELGGHLLKVSNPKLITEKHVESILPDSTVLALDFDDDRGTVAYDSSGYDNDGDLSGNIIGDFENTLDSFTVNCTNPQTSFVDGKIGKGIKVWMTSGSDRACINKLLDSPKNVDYTIWFYGKGYVRALIWNNSHILTYVEDVEAGCRTPDANSNIYQYCNGNNPYTDWRLFKLVVFRDSVNIPTVYFYSNQSAGESQAGYYDFITNGPVWVNGKYGSALQFDGFDDYVEVSDNLTLDFLDNNHTILAWVRASSLQNTWHHFLGKFYDVSTYYNGTIFRVRDTGRINVQVFNDGTKVGEVSTNDNDIFLDTWYMVAYQVSGDELSVWINGVKHPTTDTLSNNIANNNQSLFIGKRSVSDGYLWNGTINSVRIFNKALAPDETLILKPSLE